MGICKVCKTEQPEVFSENPVCWNCGFEMELKKHFPSEPPKTEKLNTKNTPSHSEVELIF